MNRAFGFNLTKDQLNVNCNNCFLPQIDNLKNFQKVRFWIMCPDTVCSSKGLSMSDSWLTCVRLVYSGGWSLKNRSEEQVVDVSGS